MSNNSINRRFECKLEYKSTIYDIELSYCLRDCIQFEDIFEKLSQIIEIICNEKITFESKRFEVFKERETNFREINDLKFWIRKNDLIRVSNKTAVNPINRNGFLNNPSFVRHDANPNIGSNHLQNGSYSQTSPPNAIPEQIGAKNAIFLTQISQYSANNCDLLLNFEWTSVIHEKMCLNGITELNPNVWKDTYKTYVDIYIDTLQKYNSINIATHHFKHFEEFNSLYFNARNSLYYKILDARNVFLSKFEKRWKNQIKLHTLPESEKSYEVLIKQKHLYGNPKIVAFVSKLSQRIEDIKGVNLILQSIRHLRQQNRNIQDIELFNNVSRILSETGLKDWDSTKCKQKLREMILFYRYNLDFYLRDVRKHKIIEYVFEFLNIIPKIDYKTTFHYNPSVSDALLYIAYKVEMADNMEFKEQSKLLIKVPKDLDNSQINSANRVQNNPLIANPNVTPVVTPQLTTQSIPHVISGLPVNGLNATQPLFGSLPITGMGITRTVANESVTLLDPRLRNRQINNRFDQTFNTDLQLNKDQIQMFPIFFNYIKDFSLNNCDLLVRYEWETISLDMADNCGVKFTSDIWRQYYISFCQQYIKALRSSTSYDEAKHNFPFFDIFNELLFNEINSLYKDISDSRYYFLSKTNHISNKSIIHNLKKTTEQQKLESEKRRECLIQRYFEENIAEIKGFNLVVKAIKDCPLVCSDVRFLSEVVETVNRLGLNWTKDKCIASLKTWIEYYYNEFHCKNKDPKLLNNRIINYCYKFINISSTEYLIKLEVIFARNGICSDRSISNFVSKMSGRVSFALKSTKTPPISKPKIVNALSDSPKKSTKPIEKPIENSKKRSYGSVPSFSPRKRWKERPLIEGRKLVFNKNTGTIERQGNRSTFKTDYRNRGQNKSHSYSKYINKKR